MRRDIRLVVGLEADPAVALQALVMVRVDDRLKRPLVLVLDHLQRFGDPGEHPVPRRFLVVGDGVDFTAVYPRKSVGYGRGNLCLPRFLNGGINKGGIGQLALGVGREYMLEDPYLVREQIQRLTGLARRIRVGLVLFEPELLLDTTHQWDATQHIYCTGIKGRVF